MGYSSDYGWEPDSIQETINDYIERTWEDYFIRCCRDIPESTCVNEDLTQAEYYVCTRNKKLFKSEYKLFMNQNKDCFLLSKNSEELRFNNEYKLIQAIDHE